MFVYDLGEEGLCPYSDADYCIDYEKIYPLLNYHTSYSIVNLMCANVCIQCFIFFLLGCNYCSYNPSWI